MNITDEKFLENCHCIEIFCKNKLERQENFEKYCFLQTLISKKDLKELKAEKKKNRSFFNKYKKKLNKGSN